MQKDFQHIDYEVLWKDDGIGGGKTLFWEECKWMEELTTNHFESNAQSKRMKPFWQKMMLA
jgi:hypothetical protein